MNVALSVPSEHLRITQGRPSFSADALPTHHSIHRLRAQWLPPGFIWRAWLPIPRAAPLHPPKYRKKAFTGARDRPQPNCPGDLDLPSDLLPLSQSGVRGRATGEFAPEFTAVLPNSNPPAAGRLRPLFATFTEGIPLPIRRQFPECLPRFAPSRLVCSLSPLRALFELLEDPQVAGST
jgi:hypothetical protein